MKIKLEAGSPESGYGLCEKLIRPLIPKCGVFELILVERNERSWVRVGNQYLSVELVHPYLEEKQCRLLYCPEPVEDDEGGVYFARQVWYKYPELDCQPKTEFPELNGFCLN